MWLLAEEALLARHGDDAVSEGGAYVGGAILVFLTGLMEITTLYDQLGSNAQELPRDR